MNNVQTFVARVKEKENELKEAEQILHEKFESLRKRHAEDKKRLEERRQGMLRSCLINLKLMLKMKNSCSRNYK